LGGVELLQRCVLSGGDDYELCFTAPAMRHAEIMNISMRLGLPLTRIGNIVAGSGCVVHDASGNLIDMETGGYDHFR
jgi:thiamine-monophosphate kinase